jgi:peroxiredoxin
VHHTIFLGLILFTLFGNAPGAFAGTIPREFAAMDLLTHQTKAISWSQASHGTVVVFLSSRCPCSSSHEESLKKLHQEFASQGFNFIGIHSNQDESTSEAETHFKQVSLPFPVLQDDGAKLANALGALKTPHVYVLSPSGELLFQGGVDDSHIAQIAKKPYLKNALLQIQQGQRPDPSEVRVLGCVIKR